MVAISRAWYNGSYTMTAKPIKCLELHYTMILSLNTILSVCFNAKWKILVSTDQPFIIVEYCSMGNLRDFLLSSHGSVVYANMAGNSLTLTCRDLLSFAWQCARGMSYLSSQKVSCCSGLFPRVTI